MRVLPQSPLDWVLLAVGTATAIIIAVAMQDLFVDLRVNNPRIRALQDVGVGIAVTHFGVSLVRGSAGPVITLLALGAIAVYVIAARREERQLEDRFGEAFRNYKLGTGYVVPPVFRLVGRSLN
jgi:protein-S-isoprenylcysteine O-methyltransferase Ste14